ncbi:G patch domain-containing protein 4 [Culicoides brevitarsis]|uniref:G patch domain-containing protein 4 n=1 Tax=Culicoides brevitarsis TaxID=469753 RepID=UPI00307B798E
MNFGENILKKFGWKEGDSLGKNNNGLTVPIKAHRKTNLAGLGASTTEEITGNNWWERVYNEASENLNVAKSKSGQVTVSQKDEDGVEITNKSYSLKKLKEKTQDRETYGGKFIKAATLLADVGKETEIEDHVKTEDIQVKQTKTLSDAELFAACGGLTAHKGARHGLKLTGKLNRLKEQDDALLAKLQERTKPVSEGIFREIAPSDLKTPEWQNAKNKKKPNFNISSIDDHPNLQPDELIDVLNVANYSKKSKKKSKKDRKTELELIENFESVFGSDTKPAEEEKNVDSDGDVICDDSIKKSKVEKLSENSKGITKKKKKKGKKGNNDYLTEKALEMIDSGNEEIVQETTTSKKKKKKKKNKQQTEVKTPEIPQVPKKPIKIKADSGSESDGNEVDVIERINEEQHHLRKKRKIERTEDFSTQFEQEHKKKCKKFKNDTDDDNWSMKKSKKKPSKAQKKMEKKLCKKLEETLK